MKNLLKIALTSFAFAALCGPGLAQDETAAPPNEEAEAAVPAKPAPKKAAAKKKPVKKKKEAPAPVSEYKFKTADTPSSYKFDKMSNPIIEAKPKARVSSKKGKKGKKSAAADVKKTAEQPAPKLKKASRFGEESPANNPADSQADNPANNPEEGQ
jgi:hypothetical protein